MALNPAQLTTDLIQVFQEGMSAPDSDTVAAALAQAIHVYVSAAEVSGVAVDVVDLADNPIGTGTQAGSVSIT